MFVCELELELELELEFDEDSEAEADAHTSQTWKTRRDDGSRSQYLTGNVSHSFHLGDAN